MKVEQILQQKGATVYTVNADATLQDAVGTLNKFNIGALVVTEIGGKVVGILSERDIVRRLSAPGGNALSLKVRACMTPNPVTCGLGESVDSMLSTMTERRIRHLPIMADGVLVGLVSIGDVVKQKIELTEREAAELRDYIAS